jgi:hypothetical protein
VEPIVHPTFDYLVSLAQVICPSCAVDAAVAVICVAPGGIANTVSVVAVTTHTTPLSNVYVVPPGKRMCEYNEYEFPLPLASTIIGNGTAVAAPSTKFLPATNAITTAPCL